jgi:coenzyme F420-reducing hydrogenase gamma subunit
MPERQKGRDPGPRPESEKAPFHLAARYADEHTSETPYDQAQQAIYETPCDLSAYRLRLGEALEWHVAVLGAPPAPELVRRIEAILSTGEPVTLPGELLAYLTARRKEQTQQGEWVEKHHFPRRRRLR